ncbi:translation elongation factor Ts [Candidatus Dependentiae bacterium]|nr:MAG: translation elongation factor Ts [Candidatus Dependentiae bacterium]
MAAEVTMDLIKQLRLKTSVGTMACKKALIEANGDIEEAVKILRKKGAAVAAKRADNATNHGIVATSISDDSQMGSLIEISCETDFAENTDALKGFAASLAKHVMKQESATSISDLMNEKMQDSTFTVNETLEDVISKISENTKIGRTASFSTDEKGIITSYIHPGSTLGVLIELAASDDLSAHKDKLVAIARSFCMQASVTSPLCVRPEEIDSDILAKEKSFIQEQLATSGKPAAMIEKITVGKLAKYYEEVCLLNQKYIKDDKLKISDVCDQIGKEIGTTVTIKRFARFSIGQ